MKPVCEIIVQEILPSVRAMLARELVEKHKLTQSLAAKRLGVTQGAVSQYRRQIRGFRVKTLETNKEVADEIARLANLILSNDFNLAQGMQELCKICKLICSKGIVCEVHKQNLKELENCKLCLSE